MELMRRRQQQLQSNSSSLNSVVRASSLRGGKASIGRKLSEGKRIVTEKGKLVYHSCLLGTLLTYLLIVVGEVDSTITISVFCLVRKRYLYKPVGYNVGAAPEVQQ